MSTGHRRTSVAVLVGCAAAAATLVAQNPMRPGRWEVTVQMQMANLPVAMPEMKTTECITAEQLEDPENALPNASPNTSGQACKVSDYKVDGSTVTWAVVCSAPQQMTGSGEMTFEGDTYTGTMKLLTPQGEMSMKYSGRRLGECTP